MLALGSYVFTELVTGRPLVEATPDFFRPIIFNPAFLEFMDASFSVASGRS